MLPYWEVHDLGQGPYMLMVHGFLSSRFKLERALLHFRFQSSRIACQMIVECFRRQRIAKA